MKNIEKEIKKVCQLLFENIQVKTPLEKRIEYESQLKTFNEKWRVKFFQLKQDYLLQRKQLFDKFYSQ